MKRKLTGLILSLLFLISLAPAALAASLPFIHDEAELMSGGEADALSEKIEALSQEYDMDLVIVTRDTLDGKTPEAFADDYYDDHGYGENGILFLLSMEDRDWYISTSGTGIYALTDYGIQQVAQAALPSLGAGDYYEGFDAYLDALPIYLDAFRQGTPIDGQADFSGDYYHGTQETVVSYENPFTLGDALMIAVPIGLIAAGIVLLVMRFAMNTKRPMVGAGDYLKENSFRLSLCQDLFLYSSVSKTQRPQETRSGGGSSVHTSSSGSSHGGGGGKF